MASFNPDPQVSELQTRDQTGASRGTGTDQSFETLFKGLGDLVGGVSTTVDTAIQNRIEKDARYGFDSLNDEMGVSTNVVPADITRSGEGLQKLASAHMQGKITQEYYYQRLAATLKGLRTKYPGYEKEVDSIVQNVTGVRPANAFRDALWSAIDEQNRAAASSAGKFDSWASQKENSEVLGVLYPDFWTNQEKYGSPEAQNQVKANVSQYQGRVRIAEDTVKLQSSDKAVALPQIGRLFSTVVNGHIVGGAEAAGVDQPNVQSMLDNALQDGAIDQTEKENILGFLSQIRARTEVDLRNRVASSDWGSNFTSQELNEQIRQALDPITQMETLVNSDNVSAAARIASRNKAVSDQATFELYQKFPELSTASALRNISQVGADTVVNEIIEKSGGGLGFVNRVLGKDLASGVASGTVSLSQVTERVSEAAGKTGKEKEGILSQVLDATTSVLASPEASKEVKLSTVQSTYGDKLDSTWKVVDDTTGPSGASQRMRLFGKMFNPAITQQIVALNDPQALQTYIAAAADKFQQIPEFRRAAATLSEQIPYSKYARVRYDEDRNRMIVEVNREALGNTSFFRRTDEAMTSRELVRATDSFNQALSFMAPIIEASGVDETEGVAALAEMLALNLENGTPGFFSFVSQAAVESVDKLLSGRVNPAGGVAKEGSPLAEAGRTNFENQSRAIDPNFTGEWSEIGTQQTPSEVSDEISWNLGDGGELPELPVESMPRLDDAEVSTVTRAGRGWTELQLPDGTRVRRTGARNWRNNNPGNIEYGAFARQNGAVGTDGRFAVFPSYEAGRNAKEALLFDSKGYRNKTIASAISRYAPPSENDTTAYSNAVARAVGVPASTPLSELTPSQRQRMLDAMERVEGFRVGRETRVE